MIKRDSEEKAKRFAARRDLDKEPWEAVHFCSRYN
jgi:hypothetical protein